MNDKNKPSSFRGEAARESLPDDMRELFARCGEKLGFVPNVFLAYAHEPEKFRAFRLMSNDLMKGESPLTELEREMIAVTVSSANHCHYCLASHGAAVRVLSGSAELGDTLVHNYRAAQLPPKQKAMLDFAHKLTVAPQEMEASDREKLSQAGFCDTAIFHICAVAGFYNMTNRIAAAIDMRPNEEYFNMARDGKE